MEQLPFGHYANFAWSPDDARLAYTAALEDEDGKLEVHVPGDQRWGQVGVSQPGPYLPQGFLNPGPGIAATIHLICSQMAYASQEPAIVGLSPVKNLVTFCRFL